MSSNPQNKLIGYEGNDFFGSDTLSAGEAISKAQHIAFAPMVFQASLSLRNLGILSACDTNDGLDFADIRTETGLSEYGLRVLLEAALGIGLLTLNDGKYRITKTAWFLLHDKMTNANMDFSADVCYDGIADLQKSIETGKPVGLKAFGDNWNTVYEALPHLPEKAASSWYKFDHFYSDDAFGLVLPILFANKPKSILDIGGNTGRFALECLRYDPNIRIGIADLPGTLENARNTIKQAGFEDRVEFHPVNMLDQNQKLPEGYDIVWTSQFLDCFSETEIVSILKRIGNVLDKNSKLYIMEPFWDRQRREISAFCLQMTSLYFTAIANGNSQMYGAKLFLQLIEQSGLGIIQQHDNIGVCQSLIACTRS